MRHIFITGGAGFIGAHLVQHFAKRHLVTVFDNFTRDTLSQLGMQNHPNVKIVIGDILDLEHLQESMKGTNVVIHAAAMVGVREVNKDQLATMKVNVLGTHNVLEAARLCEVRDRVVVFSTSEIFGSMAYNCSETDPIISGSPKESRWSYGVSKIAGEHFAHAYYKQYNLPVVCVRPFNVYGPGQAMRGAMKEFITRAVRNEELILNGDGSPIRSWCYIDDFVDCIERCVEQPEAIGESFNIGNPAATITVRGLAEKVCSLLGSKSIIRHTDALISEIHIRIPCIDKAKSLLGFSPCTNLDDGILRTAEFMKSKSEKTSVPAAASA